MRTTVKHVFAIDIGGTKLAAGIVAADGTLLERASTPTPRGTDPEVLWRSLAALIDLLPARDCVAVGVGTGGPMTRGGLLVSPLNIPAWRGFPLRDRITAHTGLSTWVDNDAKALALGEGWVGAATGIRDYIAMVVSTGVGGGIVLDGRLLDGAAGNAGHVGHIVVVPSGRLCACGAQGCLEAEASGTAIATITGRPPAEADSETVIRTGELVGRAIAATANLLDLRLAVVSGSVALGFATPFFDAAQAAIDRLCRIDYARGMRIVPGALGDAGPLIGAARVAWQHLPDGSA